MKNKSLTLIELIICLTLMLVMVVGFSTVDTFIRYNVVIAARRSEVQNQASFLISHISKQINRAIGSTALGGQRPIDTFPIGTNSALEIYVDAGADHIGSGDARYGTEGDCWRAYRVCDATSPSCAAYQIGYYNNYTNPNVAPDDILVSNVRTFPVPVRTGNYVQVGFTACWNPAAGASYDNPCVTILSKIKMPSVAAN